MPVKTIIEPFRIKHCRTHPWTLRREREQLPEAAHSDLCLLPAEDVLIGLVTDSGTKRCLRASGPQSWEATKATRVARVSITSGVPFKTSSAIST